MIKSNAYRGYSLRIAVGITALVLLMAGGAVAKSIRDDATGGDCTSFGTWNSATKTCTMTTDLTEGIQIASSGVTLDGNGRTITGSNILQSIGLSLPGRSGVTIKNLNVIQFSTGVYLSNSNNNYLIGNNANSNNEDGIFLEYYSNNNTLIGNNASNNGGNYASNNGFYDGIFLSQSSDNNLTNNTAKNNAIWDFYSQADSLNNIVTNLEIGYTVISFESKDIALRNASAPASDPANFQNIGKYINATSNSADSWLFLNVSYTESDLGSLNESTLRISKNNGSWITDPSAFANNFGVNTAENYVFANITNFGSIFVPLGVISTPPPLTNINSCQDISSAGEYVLNASILNSGVSSCINITSNDVVFDGAGYTIDGVDTVNTYGVYVYNSTTALTNVTVKNLNVTDSVLR